MTFTAGVASITGAVPAGAVTFVIDGVGHTAPVVPSAGGLAGTATFTTSALALGAHTVVAQYGGGAELRPQHLGRPGRDGHDAGAAPAAGRGAAGRRGLAVRLPRDADGAGRRLRRPARPRPRQDPANYVIVGPHHQVIPVVKAVLAPGDETVVLQPKGRLNVHRAYTLTVLGTAPSGVSGATGTFLGTDPVESITIRNLVRRPAPARAASKPAPKPSAHGVDALLVAGEHTTSRRSRLSPGPAEPSGADPPDPSRRAGAL